MKIIVCFMLTLISIIMSPSYSEALEITGHRGAAFYAPENTISSLDIAWRSGVDAAEIDVRLTKDNRIAVIHDANTLRTTGKSLDVATSSYAALSKLDAGSHKNPAYNGEKIPLLEEALATVPSGKKLVIEVKSGIEILPYLLKTINESGRRENVSIISFNFEVCCMFKAANPKIPVFWIIGTQKDPLLKQFIDSCDPVKLARQNNLDGFHINYKLASTGLIKSAHEAGLKVYAWTVDDPKTAVLIKSYGIDGITSNKPDVIIEACRK